MKAMKRILAVVVCLSVCFSCVLMTAMADQKGSITIQSPTTSDATVAGKTFVVYKIFNATTNGANTSYSWYTDANDNVPFKAYFYGANGILGATEGKVQAVVDHVAAITNAYDLSEFAESLYKYIDDNSIEPFIDDIEAGDNTEVVISNLDYGYYLVYDATDLSTSESSVRSAVMLSNVDKDATITLKASRPSITKTVLDGSDYKEATASKIGDTATFKLETTVPEHHHYTTYDYIIEDTMPEGFALVEGSFVVKSNTDELTQGVEYSLDTTGTDGTDFIITFLNVEDDDEASDVFAAGKNIVVTYQATLTKEAEKANVNTAKLVYSNDPIDATSKGYVTDTATVYTYEFIFTKYAQDTDGDKSDTRLSGAEFELYADGLADPISFLAETVGTGADAYTQYTVVPSGTTGATTTLVVCADGARKGEVVIFGLNDGKYNLKETVAPDGYVLPEDMYHITITDTIEVDGTVSDLAITATHDGTGKIVDLEGQAGDVLTVWANITNKIGTALPETGGMGTTLFTILGITLMAGALAFFTLRKRGSAF